MASCHHKYISLAVFLLGSLTTESALANVGIPVIFPTLMGMTYALIPVIAIEAVVLIARLGFSTWKSALIVTATNVASTFVGIPITWLLFYLITSKATGLLIKCLPDTLKPQKPYLVEYFFTPWWYPSSDVEKNLHWMYPTALVILMIPFFLASWFLEYQIAFRLIDNPDRGPLRSAVFYGNLLTYGLMTLVVLGIFSYPVLSVIRKAFRVWLRKVRKKLWQWCLNIRVNRRPRWISVTAAIITIASSLYLSFCYFVVSSSLAAVRILPEESPQNDGLLAERLYFESARDDIPLTGWLLPSNGDRAIVMIHGLDGNSWSGAEPDIASAYVEAGYTVLLFDQRGQGLSGDAPLGLGWHERGDVSAAVNVLLERGFEPGHIGLHGTSYGAATALLSAAVIPEVGALVADSAFADMRDLMDSEIERRTGVPAVLIRLALRPGIALLAHKFYELDFEAIPPEAVVSQIAPRPILFVHGEKDKVIPLEHVHRLHDAAVGNQNRVWVLPELGHAEGVWIGNNPREISPLRETYLRKIVAFFDQSLK